MSLIKPLQQTALETLGSLLASVSTANGYRTDWDRVVYWQDMPTEYDRNWLTYRDIFSEFSEPNRQHEQKLTVEIQGLLFGQDPATAGILALNDLIEVLGTDLTLGGTCLYVRLKQAEKEVVTGGKPVCSIVLSIEIVLRTGRFQPR